MLSARRLKVLSLALLMSGGTVVLTQQWLQGAVRKAQVEARAAAPAPPTGRRVLVANADLPAGAILTPAQLRWQAWPANATTGAFLTDDDTSLEKLSGAVVRTHMEPGEPLTRGRIAYPGDRSFLAAVLRPGYRAITVNVSASSGVAGFVMPGDHVDLILTRSQGDNTQKRFVSETVLTDVRVVGMDQRANDEKKDVVVPQTATLEVTPKGAEVIAVVSELGRLSLSLRSLAAPETPAEEPRIVTRTSDREAVQAPAAVVRASRPAAPAAPPRETVEVVRGAQSAVVPAGPTYRVTPLDSRVPAFDVKQTAGGAP